MNEEQRNGLLNLTLLMNKVDIKYIKAVDSDLHHEMWEAVEVLLLCASQTWSSSTRLSTGYPLSVW